jgi:hypothetical protein
LRKKKKKRTIFLPSTAPQRFIVKTAIPFYMHPSTARRLLSLSRAFNACQRQRRQYIMSARILGWCSGAAVELADIAYPLPEIK